VTRTLSLCPVLLVAALVGLAAGGSEAGWQSHSPLPEPRSEVAAGRAASELVVVGGFTADGHNSARADAYWPAGDRWRRMADLPAAVDHAAGASANGRMYVVGGYGADRQPLRSVFVLDGGFWRALPRMPGGRAAAAAAVANGRLYVLGGRNGRRALARDTFVFTFATGRWERIRGPAPREHLAAASSRGRVYAIGGRAAGIDTNSARFEVYDPGTRTWSRLAPLPEARGGTGAAAIGGRIVSVGGEQPAGTIRTVYSYDTATKRWSRLPDLPTPRHGLGVVEEGGSIWVLAGGPVPGLTVSGAVESLKP
jgi:non-specific serine/threonine protein kinase